MKTLVLSVITIALALTAGAAQAGDDGRIQIRPYINKAGASLFVVWDTTTGASKIYYWSSEASKYVPTEIGLPAKPLNAATGSIMIEPYVNKYGASMFVVWDTGSGESVIYYWDKGASKYVATEVGLPRAPLK